MIAPGVVSLYSVAQLLDNLKLLRKELVNYRIERVTEKPQFPTGAILSAFFFGQKGTDTFWNSAEILKQMF